VFGCVWLFSVDSPACVVDRTSSLYEVFASLSQDSRPIRPDPTGSRGDGQHDSNPPVVSISAPIPARLVSEFDFRMLSFVYQQPFSGSPDPCPSLSLSTAASVYARRGRLLPTLATRGAGNALKMTLADTTYTRSGTISTNTEQARNVISAASDVLTTNNREGTTEVREKKEQQRGEAGKDYILREVLRQSSPTRVPCPVVFGRLTGCVTRDVSALRCLAVKRLLPLGFPVQTNTDGLS
jgi:hypothetical protein